MLKIAINGGWNYPRQENTLNSQVTAARIEDYLADLQFGKGLLEINYAYYISISQ